MFVSTLLGDVLVIGKYGDVVDGYQHLFKRLDKFTHQAVI